MTSGIPHLRLLKSLKFKSDFSITGSVGFTSIKEHMVCSNILKIYKALYLGRFSSEKNLVFLIKKVNTLSNIELTSVSAGPQLKEVEEMGGANFSFIGHIENWQLDEVFATHHFLILFSISAKWGLLVEESLQSLVPVIVSDVVGCSEDIVSKLGIGLVFKTGSVDEFYQTFEGVTKHSVYENFVKNARAINWNRRRQCQVATYGSLGRKSEYSYISIK